MKLLITLISLFYSLQVFSVEPKSLVSVNGKGINEIHFAIFVQQLPRKPEKVDRNIQVALLNELIKTRLLSDAAEVTKLDKNPTVQAALDIARMRVLAEVAIKQHLASHPVKEDDLKALYEKQYAGKKTSEYNASHILLNDEETAKTIIRSLNKGTDFKTLAKQHSTDASASKGGNLGWFNASDMLKPFADAVASLKKNEFSQTAVKSDYGWHVIKLDDVRVTEPPKYEDVTPQLTAMIQRKRLIAYVAQLQKTADIKVSKPPVKDDKPATEE